MNDDNTTVATTCQVSHSHELPEHFLGQAHPGRGISFCIREQNHAGKHLDYFGNYWWGPFRLPKIDLPKNKDFWTGVLVGVTTYAVVSWALR